MSAALEHRRYPPPWGGRGVYRDLCMHMLDLVAGWPTWPTCAACQAWPTPRTMS